MKKIIIFSLLIITLLLSVFIIEDVKALSIEDYNSPYLDKEWFGADIQATNWLTTGNINQNYDNIVDFLGLDSQNETKVIITPYIITAVEYVWNSNPPRNYTYYYIYDTILFELNGSSLIITFGKEAMETLYSSVKNYYQINSVNLTENEGFTIYLDPNQQAQTNYQDSQDLYYEGIYFADFDNNRILYNICELFSETDSIYLKDIYDYSTDINTDFKHNGDETIRPRLIDYPEIFYYSHDNTIYRDANNQLTAQIGVKDTQIANLQANLIQMTDLTDGTFFNNLFSSMTTLFNTKIIGNITLGIFVLVPLLILVLGVILKVARG